MAMRNITGFVFLFLTLLSGVFLVPSTKGLSSSQFSIIWITDTQHLAEQPTDNFNLVCGWIANNSASLCIEAVVHTGDIVDDASNLTQWECANSSMNVLLENNIPYCWNAGNHDALGEWIGKDYRGFDARILRGKAYWVDDAFDVRNTAIRFTYANRSFLVIDIEYHANDEVLRWASGLLTAHPGYNVILATHSYLNETCAYDDWAIHFRDTLLVSNPNIFMTLSGHYMEKVRTNRTFIDNRHELFFNYQSVRDSAVRILTFNLEHNFINVSTYDPVANQFLVDSDNQFILEIHLTNVSDEQDLFVPESPSSAVAFSLVMALTLVAFFVRKNNSTSSMRKVDLKTMWQPLTVPMPNRPHFEKLICSNV